MARLGRSFSRPLVFRQPRMRDANVDLPTFSLQAEFPALAVTSNTASVPLPTFALQVQFPSINILRGQTPHLPTFALQVAFPAFTPQVPFIPGQYITADGQVEWGGVLWGAGTPFRIQKITGWDSLPALDNLNVDEASGDGAYAARTVPKQRIVTISMMLDSITTPSQIADLVKDTRSATRILEDATEWPLVIRTYTETLIAYGKVIDREIPNDEEFSVGAAKPAVQIACSNPRRYTPGLANELIVAGTEKTLTNEGDRSSKPTIRIHGPATGPKLTNSTLGRVLAFDITLAPGEDLEIDVTKGRAKVAGINRSGTLATTISVPIEDFVLAAGDNTISYTATSGGTNGALWLWRHSYL